MKKNWLHISIIVLFSIVVWTIVTLSDNFYTNIYLPVRIKIKNPDYSLSYVSDKFVIVGVQGEGWVLSSYYWGANRYFDITLKSKKKEVDISTRDLIKQNHIFTSNVNIVSINPEILKVEIDKKLIKEVFVKPKYNLKLRNSYGLIGKPKVEPAKIKLEGAYSIVKDIDTVTTENIVISNGIDSLIYYPDLKFPKFTTSPTQNVKVIFDIQKIVDKEIDEIPIKIVGAGRRNSKLLVFPNKLNVVIRGGIRVVGRMGVDDITAYVLFKDALVDTTASLKPRINLPRNVKLVTFTPEKIDYIIKK